MSINDMFCPKCGKKRGILRTNCPHCNAPITNSDDVFCVACGKKLAAESVAEKVKNNGLIKSVSSDFSQSKALKMVKTSAEGGINKIKKVDSSVKKKLIIAILVVLLVIILPLIIISNIHKCGNCGETYFGKPNAVTYWYETFYVCDECV